MMLLHFDFCEEAVSGFYLFSCRYSVTTTSVSVHAGRNKFYYSSSDYSKLTLTFPVWRFRSVSKNDSIKHVCAHTLIAM